MTREDDRRRSFRIVETVLLSCTGLEDSEFEAGIEAWRIGNGNTSRTRSLLVDLDARLDEHMFRIGADASSASEALRILNEKINVIAYALPDFKSATNALAEKSSQRCELSSEGMHFGLDESLPQGAGVVLQFIVLPENRYFETFARVVRSGPSTNDDFAPYTHSCAVTFEGMSPAERENLIQHLFTRQSQTLRLRRRQLDEEEQLP